ncbi:MAG: hypothetical protein ACI376_09000 [Candidatus Bruticola sp.]
MKVAKSVKISIWCFILFNLMVAYCCIWIFTRMLPSIEAVIQDNETSIHVSMTMMAMLTQHQHGLVSKHIAMPKFERYLKEAEDLVSEKGETEYLKVIREHYRNAFEGKKLEFNVVTDAIVRLENVNREAMHNSIVKAQHMGRTGAWGIVFMAIMNFIAGLIFMHNLNLKFIEPMEEIEQTISDFKKGNKMRRCLVSSQSMGMEKIMRNLNDLLDSIDQ